MLPATSFLWTVHGQEDTLVISGSIGGEKFEAVRYKNEPKLKTISIPSGELTVSFEQTEK